MATDTTNIPWDELAKSPEQREIDRKLEALDKEEAAIAARLQSAANRWAEEDRAKEAANDAAERRAQQIRDFEAHQAAAQAAHERMTHFACTRTLALRRANEAQSNDERARFFERAYDADNKIAQWQRIEADERAQSRAQISVNEAPIYDRTSPHQWLKDMALRSVTRDDLPFALQAEADAAVERLQRYGNGLKFAVGDEAIRARQAVQELRRGPARGAKALPMKADGPSGSLLSFVPPAYLLADASLFRQAPPTFYRHSVTARQLPESGMSISIPAFGAAFAVGAHDLDAPLAETDPEPGASLKTVDLVTFSARVTASLELFERSDPEFQPLLMAQLAESLNSQLDSQAIATALNGVVPSTRTSFSVAGVLSDIGRMAASLESANGVFLTPDGLYVQPAQGEFILSQLSAANGLPIAPLVGANRAEGVSGFQPAGIPLYFDSNLPTVSGNGQLVMTSSRATLGYVGTPILAAYAESGLAGSLQTVFVMRCYGTFIQRWLGTAATTGSAFAAPVWS